MRLHDIAARLGLAADEMGEAASRLADLDPGGRGYGAQAPGRVGELGRALHADGTAALIARCREATALSARLSDSAQAVLAVAAAYRDAERAAYGRNQGSTGEASW